MSEASPETSYEKELLNSSDLYNELIMTRLRTSNGIPLKILESTPFKKYWNCNRGALQKYIDRGAAKIENNSLILTEEGWLISDTIFTDLFY